MLQRGGGGGYGLALFARVRDRIEGNYLSERGRSRASRLYVMTGWVGWLRYMFSTYIQSLRDTYIYMYIPMRTGTAQ